MECTFNRKQNTGLVDYAGYQTIAPTSESGSRGILGDVQGVGQTASTPEQRSQQPSLGGAIGGAIVLIGLAWLTGMIAAELFGSSADLTAVEQQILASA